MKDKLKFDIKEIIPWIVLGVAFLFATVYVARCGLDLLDSDQAAELILAEMQNHEHSILSSDWYYGSSLRIFEVTAFLRVGFLLSPHNWHVARVIGQVVIFICMTASYIFFGTSFGSRKASVYTAAVLMLPFGYWYHFHVLLFGFYAPYIMTTALGLGIVIRFIKFLVPVLKNGGDKNSYIMLGILTGASGLLSFLNTVGSVRMLMNFYVPLLTTAVCLLLIRILRPENKKARAEKKEPEYISAGAFLRCPEIAALGMIVVTLIFAMAGYMINSRVLEKKYPYESQTVQSWIVLNLNNLLTAWSSLVEDFGYPVDNINMNNVDLFTPEGILGALGLVTAGFIVFSLYRLIKRFKTLNYGQRVVVVFFINMLMVVGVTFGFLSTQTNGSYWLPCIPAALAVIQIEIETENFIVSFGRKMLGVVIAVCFIATSISQIKLTPVSMFRADPDIRPAVQWLVDNGYQDGFAEFWVSDLAAAVSNGQLEMYTVTDRNNLDIYQWLQKKSHDDRPEGRVFVLIKQSMSVDDQIEELHYGQVPELEIVYDDDKYLVLSCDDGRMLYDAIDNYEGEE